jgi:hypothetical protein
MEWTWFIFLIIAAPVVYYLYDKPRQERQRLEDIKRNLEIEVLRKQMAQYSTDPSDPPL